MLIGLDHVVIACEDPGTGAAQVEAALGLEVSEGGYHDQLGTYNRIVWLGDSYLELVGVFDLELAAQSWLGAPCAAALDAGGGLATFALASDDLVDDVARLRRSGALLDGPTRGERRRGDGRIVRWSRATPPRLAPDEPPFLIEHDLRSAEWTDEERAARRSGIHPIGGAVRLLRLELPVADVHRTTMRYVRAIGLTFRPSLAGHGARDASIGEQTIRLLPSAGAGTGTNWPPATVVLEADVPDLTTREAALLGCRFVIASRR